MISRPHIRLNNASREGERERERERERNVDIVMHRGRRRTGTSLFAGSIIRQKEEFLVLLFHCWLAKEESKA